MNASRKIQYLHLKRPGEKPEKVAFGQELKSGGAGAVYSIRGKPDLVIKVYHEDTLNREGEIYREKIECMLVNAPNVPHVQTKNGCAIQLAWPVAAAYTLRGSFAGFAMPTVDFQRTTELEYALMEKQARLHGLRHDLGARILLAYNLAAVVSRIHAQGHAIVDLKPINLKFYKEELYVAVLDCDGFFINIPGKNGDAPQVTPEYLAPEFQGAPVSNPEHQDRFALAVIIFRLLNYNTHPFAGVPNPNVNVPSEIGARIKDGLYPYGNISHKKVSPHPGSVHEAFSQELRELFDRAFSMRPALRPSSAEWASALAKFTDRSKQLLRHCTRGHLYFAGMPCMSCLREQILSGAASDIRAKGTSSSTHSAAPTSRVAPAPAFSHTSARPKTQQARTNPSPAPPSVSNVGVTSSLFQKISRIPKLEVFLVTMFLLSVAGFFADFAWVFWPSAILLFIPVFFHSGSEPVEVLVGVLLLAVIWYAILAGIQYMMQHYWEFILIYAAVSFIASILIYLFLGKPTSPARPRVGKSAFGGLALSALLFGVLWAWWPSFYDLKGEWVLFFSNPEQEKSNIADRQPVPAVTKQAGTEQIQPQNVAIQDTDPQSIVWSNQSFPGDAPGGEMTPDPMISAAKVVGETPSVSAGWIGVGIRALSPGFIHSMGLEEDQGVSISEVLNSGPAAQAGMAVGDILVSVNHKTVGNGNILEVVSGLPVGKVAQFEVLRNDARIQLLVKVEQKP